MRTVRAAVLLLGCAGGAVFGAESAPAPKPKLIVAISIDQLAAGLFDQYRNTFNHGFKRLLEHGAVYSNGYQSHANTETCPGHSTLLSGRHPSATGIIANFWTDTSSGANVYCVEDAGMTVPGRPRAPRGPKNLRVSTLGEWLRAADPASRSFAVSGKDRAAITMAGHAPDGVFWWDDELGFNTYVRPGETEAQRLAPVANFNAQVDKAWRKALPQWQPLDARCNRLAGPHAYGDMTLPHTLPPVLERDRAKSLREDPAFKAWVRASPELDRLTLALANVLLDAFKLGRGAGTDLLSVSLSATDYIGHRFGNQGIEMCDQLAYLDRALGQLFTKLDGLKVPYLVVLSADHGGADAPELLSERGFPASHAPRTFLPDLNKALREQLQLDFNPLSGEPGSLYVTRKRTPDESLRRKIVAATIVLLKQRPYVAAAFTRDEVLATRLPAGVPVDELSLLERFAESMDAERSPDVLVAFVPYFSEYGAPRAAGDYIAGHGSPWNYNRRVPILFMRTGGVAFEQYLPVETVDIAPTLAAILGIATPEMDGRCLDLDPAAGSTCQKAP